MMIIDTCGLLCPQPIIKVRKELKTAQVGDDIIVLTDNQTALANLSSYLKELRINVATVAEQGVWKLEFTLQSPIDSAVKAEEFCSVKPVGGYLLVLKSQYMGEGDDNLGAILLRAYLNALAESESLPTAVVLYNGGVWLAMKNSDTATALSVLEAKGIPVCVCGTWLDFYGIKDVISVGVVSNMYKITELTAKASHIVYP